MTYRFPSNARPLPTAPLIDLPVPLHAVPEPDTFTSKVRITRRHSRRLHMSRMGARALPWQKQHEDVPRCSGCGTEVDNFTEGCDVCWDRRRSRERRV